jgi:AcrR family transcriptional regulator
MTEKAKISSRDRLVDAMESLLWERGYADTSPKDVLKMAEVGQGSMYHYFASKHELAMEAIRHNVEKSFGGREILEESGSPLNRIERYLQYPRQGIKGCRVGRMTQDPQVFNDPEMIALIGSAFDRQLVVWAQVLGQARRIGELPESVDTDDLARTMVAVIQGGYVLSRASRSQKSMDRAIQGMIGLLRALQRQQAKPESFSAAQQDA